MTDKDHDQTIEAMQRKIDELLAFVKNVAVTSSSTRLKRMAKELLKP